MPGFLTSILNLPKWAYWIAGAVALIAAFIVWDYLDDKAAIEADRNASNAKAAEKARKADNAAHGAADERREAVEEGNRRAEDAARGSDDPLADGLRELGR